MRTTSEETLASLRQLMRQDKAELTVHAIRGNERIFQGVATVRDLQACGVCVEMEVRVATGTVVEFSGSGRRFRGICRHSGIGRTRYVMAFELVDSDPGRSDNVPAAW
jgi:hypothetical protein